MTFEEFVRWLAFTELQRCSVEQVEELLGGVLAEIENAVSEYEAANIDWEESRLGDIFWDLRAIQDDLSGGVFPLEKLLQFRESYPPRSEVSQTSESGLEDEIQQIADGLSEEQWKTETYCRFESALKSYRDGGEYGDLCLVLQELDKVLQEACAGYEQTSILESEVTLESSVVHRNFVLAVESWRTALEVFLDLEQSPENQQAYEEALHSAQFASSILIAIQIYNNRVQALVTDS